MLDKQDLKILKAMFADAKIDLRDEIRASEMRIKHEIITGVADMLDLSILPQLEVLDHRLIRAEKHLRLA